uniref:MAK10-like protein n=1 Tax=Tanacetum cinerariifolium TaxID=118510 RepID=A0A6L2KW96_TANCI|nr:hypothetical protein [Tanacetum cinerariifolium]
MWSQEPVSYDKHALWESLIGGANVNSSMDLQSTRSLLERSPLNVESSLSLNFRLSSGIITSIWIGSRKPEKSDRQRTLCFQRLSKNVHKKHRYPKGVEDLQLGVESYQKKLNLTKPDTYRFDLKRKEVYTTYSNPRGFIYQNKGKQNRLMRIDELHKFSDGTLNDVRTALDDRLKAEDEEDHVKSGEVCWRETVRRRLQDATMDHMIYHMMSLSYTEPEGSTQGYPLASVEVFRYDKRSKSENMGIVPIEMELILEHTQQDANPIRTLGNYSKPSHECYTNTIELPEGNNVVPLQSDTIRLGDSKPFDTLADLGSCVNIIPLYLFKKLNIRLLEETDYIFKLADENKSYPVRIVKDVEVHIGKLKLLNDFYPINMKKDPETPLLVGRGFLATSNAVLDCRKAKIMDKPPKDGDGAWYAKIRIIDPDGEEFTKTLQSIPTTRKLFERESQKEIINLDNFHYT